MAKFNAGTAVEAMEYDFTDYGGSSGQIPEPTSKHVDVFFDRIKSLAQEVKRLQTGKQDSSPISEVEAGDMLAAMDDLNLAEYEEALADAIADLCQGTPSGDEISKLPFRVRAAFMQWLIGELRPEAPRPATMR